MAGKKRLDLRNPRQVQRGVFTKKLGRSYYWIKYNYCSSSTKAKWATTPSFLSEQTPSKDRELVLPRRDTEDVEFLLPIEYVNGGVL